jgi:tripartite-type tricarboxylate transporter receptor subunit TctC
MAIAASGAGTAFAQTYPEKPIRIVVPFSAGGGADIVGRAVATPLSRSLGQTIVVDNRAGADGQIGASQVAKSPPDGYTLLVGSTGPMVISPALETRMPYDTLRDFAAITQLSTQPIALVVHPSLPVTTVAQFVALARAQPRELNYASAGVGNGTHLAAEIFSSITGVRMVHVPYKGTAPAVTDLIGGHVQVLFSSLPVMLAHIKAGKLRALAVGSDKRMPMLPDVPTMSEAGVKGFDASSWYGLFAPAGTPAAIVARLNSEVARVLGGAEIRELLLAQGAQPVGNSSAALTAHIQAELVKWQKAVRAAGLKPQS